MLLAAVGQPELKRHAARSLPGVGGVRVAAAEREACNDGDSLAGEECRTRIGRRLSAHETSARRPCAPWSVRLDADLRRRLRRVMEPAHQAGLSPGPVAAAATRSARRSPSCAVRPALRVGDSRTTGPVSLARGAPSSRGRLRLCAPRPGPWLNIDACRRANLRCVEPLCRTLTVMGNRLVADSCSFLVARELAYSCAPQHVALLRRSVVPAAADKSMAMRRLVSLRRASLRAIGSKIEKVISRTDTLDRWQHLPDAALRGRQARRETIQHIEWKGDRQ